MPLGPYKSFDVCVKANKNKRNPEGYCASIEKKATGKWPGKKENKKTEKSELKAENAPRGLSIGNPIAEYSEKNIKKIDKSEGIKNKGKNKYTKDKGKIDKDKKERIKEKEKKKLGDKVKSSKYGEGTVTFKSKEAKRKDMITVNFKNVGKKDVYPDSVIIIEKRGKK